MVLFYYQSPGAQSCDLAPLLGAWYLMPLWPLASTVLPVPEVWPCCVLCSSFLEKELVPGSLLFAGLWVPCAGALTPRAPYSVPLDAWHGSFFLYMVLAVPRRP